VGKIFAFLGLLKTGKTVADPDAWKSGTITVNLIAAFLLALANFGTAFGLAIPVLDTNSLNEISAGVLALVNSFVHIATSENLGVGAQPKPQQKFAPRPTDAKMDSDDTYRGG